MWITGCPRSANFLIMTNGRPREHFGGYKRIKTWRSLSLFLFTLVVDILSRPVEKAGWNWVVKGFKIEVEDFLVSHLQFANETLFSQNILLKILETWGPILNLFSDC